MIKRTAKEVARHCLHRLGVKRKHAHLLGTDRAERFERIYADGVWRHGDDNVPSSGHGSSLAATESIRSQLPELLDRLGVQRVLDVGCGDFTWMREVGLAQDYVGVDIVPDLIAGLNDRFKNERRRFAVADAVEDELPEADAVLCREVLFHLSLADARKALANMLSCPRRYLILTSDRGTAFNADIESGDFRVLNLERAPFSFPRPVEVLADRGVDPRRVLAVWDAGALKL